MSALPSAAQLAQACQSGNRRAASRLLSQLESADPAVARAASDAAAQFARPQQTIGITGPPGAGKSTLIDYLAGLYRARNETLAILAVDPSSPFTGGALLGDRIRMSSLRNDSGVFIRSMGSRGASGGLASPAVVSDALRVLGACGHTRVLLETVGAGQAETEVANLADSVCVVQVPGLGDDVQLMKMGALEIADIFVVNKGDRPEAQDLKVQLELALQTGPAEKSRVLRQLGGSTGVPAGGSTGVPAGGSTGVPAGSSTGVPAGSSTGVPAGSSTGVPAGSNTGVPTGTEAGATLPPWTPPVLVVSALQRSGGEALLAACDQHAEYLKHPLLEKALARRRLVREIVWRAGLKIQDQLASRLKPGGELSALLDACAAGNLSVNAVVERVLK